MVGVAWDAHDWLGQNTEDPVLNAVSNWLEAQKKTDWKTLLGEHASSKEGQLVWRNLPEFYDSPESLLPMLNS